MDPRKPEEGWSLATQMKMFSHTADSIQKTFIEALSQTRFSTGEQNKEAKVECKADCLSTSVSRSIMKSFIFEM